MFGLDYIKAAIVGALLLLILALAGGTWYFHRKMVEAEVELASYQASATAVINERIAAQEQTKAENAQREKETLRAYKQKLDSTNTRWAAELGRLHADAPQGSDAAVPVDPSAPVRVDDATPDERLATALAGCEADRARLDALQRWVRETR